MERIKVSKIAIHSLNKGLITTVLLVLVAASIVDTSIIKLKVFIGDMNTTWNIIAFLILVIIYAIGQYLILEFMKSRMQTSAIPPLKTIHNIVSIVQYIMILVFGIIILQMIMTSSYNISFLNVTLCITGGLSITLLAYLAKKFFLWFRSNHDVIIISYATAMAMICVNIAFMITLVLTTINTESGEVRHIKSPVSVLIYANSIYNSGYIATSILSFICVWLATVLLLRYHSKKIGTAKYWIIVSAPLFYFLSQFQGFFISLFDAFRMSDPTMFGIVYTLIFSVSKPIGGILFGVAFWIVSRRVNKYAIKDYLVISAYGVILLFTTNQATNLILVPYPPFGLITAALLGLASYMLLVGIYSSAMSISRDTELRKFIHTVATKEIKLLDQIGSAQLEQELVTRVIPMVQRKANNMERESGVKTSLTDIEVMQYLDEVIAEVRNFKENNRI